MEKFDFSNHQNRDIRLQDVSKEYLDHIMATTKNDLWYPSYHIAPHHGLLNDPNGLCQIDGVYHIFYQWFPIGPVHGLKYWYHLTTRDFIDYQDLGVAMEPSYNFDLNGCYSGMLLNDNKKIIYYTGIQKNDKKPTVCYGELVNDNIINRQCIINFDNQLTTDNFRDPCVFTKNNKYYMINGGENHNNEGCLLFYESNDYKKFKYINNLRIKEDKYGYMLECPNYFEQDEKGILFFSPQGIKSNNKYDYRNVFSVVYGVGNYIDTSNVSFDAKNYYEMDKGFDFYAPQVFLDEKGRHILYGWLGNSKCEYPSDKNNWAHMLTIPRSIKVIDDKIIQEPLEELKGLRCNYCIVDSIHCLSSLSIEIEFEAVENFSFTLANEKGEHIHFKATKDEYELQRGKMSYLYNEKYGNERFAKRICQNHQVRVFIDHSSIEIFLDEGETVFTARFFIDNPIILKVSGIKAKLYNLKAINLY